MNNLKNYSKKYIITKLTFFTFLFEKYSVSFDINNKIIHNFFLKKKEKKKRKREKQFKLKRMCIYNFHVKSNI